MGKDSSPLFELINKRNRSRSGTQLPPWMQQNATGKVEQPAAEPTDSGDAPKLEPARQVRQWMTQPTVLRLPRGAVIGISAGVAVLVAITFWIGREMGEAAAQTQRTEYAQALGSLGQYQERPANPSIIPDHVPGVDDQDGVSSLDSVYAGADTAGDGDPRQPGLNYYRLTVIPASSTEEASEMAAFLESNGLDTAYIPVNNGRSLKLIVLRPFTKPLSDPAAKRFEQHLKALGREWKAKHGGSTDFKDLIPEKYRPGVN